MSRPQRRLPVGAELQPGGGVHFRVWCPDHRDISVLIESAAGGSSEVPLAAEPDGYASVLAPRAGVGDRYRFRIADDLLADPASRFQPDGPFGSSAVVDPAYYTWRDRGWNGRSLADAVIYELHCGTFTHEGTWRAAQERLPHLRDVGVTVIEVMPVAEFPGRFGWGYDGVFPYAPTRLYGQPDDLRRFVDDAHAHGLAVILDVVYNHLGPDGCVFRRFAEAYFSDRYENEWGDALNFDGPGAHAVREYFVANAGYWVDEFHFDGLRLDATQSIHDASEEHVIAAIARTARARAGDRTVLLVSENEPQQVRMVRPRDEGGYGLDALWNDDFHHSAVVALTGRNEAYYSDHRGTVQELISAAKYGYLFQGQRYAWQSKPRGTSSIGVPPGTFVNFIENHDQLANSGDGSRLHRRAAVARLRAMTALFVLMPGTPMLFQGQEMAASAPFLYFADHNPSLAVQVKRGRAEFISQFPSLASPEMQARLPAPEDPSTFERCKLDWREATVNAAWVGLHRDLIRLRREHHAFSRQVSGGVDGAAIDRDAFVLRFAADAALEERLLIVNLGADLVRASLPEPLVAPPMGTEWDVAWSSEDPRYGGGGTPCVVGKKGWSIPACSAVVLAPERADGSTRRK